MLVDVDADVELVVMEVLVDEVDTDVEVLLLVEDVDVVVPAKYSPK